MTNSWRLTWVVLAEAADDSPESGRKEQRPKQTKRGGPEWRRTKDRSAASTQRHELTSEKEQIYLIYVSAVLFWSLCFPPILSRLRQLCFETRGAEAFVQLASTTQRLECNSAWLRSQTAPPRVYSGIQTAGKLHRPFGCWSSHFFRCGTPLMFFFYNLLAWSSRLDDIFTRVPCRESFTTLVCDSTVCEWDEAPPHVWSRLS